jgi:hypothetical protein
MDTWKRAEQLETPPVLVLAALWLRLLGQDSNL